MAFHLAVLVSAALLCSAVSGFRLEASSGDSADILARVNQQVQNANLSEVTTPDQSYSTIFSRGSIKNVKAGKLDSFSVRGGPQHINRTEIDDEVVTYFDVSVGLDEVYVSYDFEYTFLTSFRGNGSVKLTIDENAAQLVGAVYTTQDQSNCSAVLQRATLTKLSSHAEIIPDTPINRIISQGFNFLHNLAISADIVTFDLIISDILKNSNFQETFSQVVCKSINFQ